jgi:hypothetical protein
MREELGSAGSWRRGGHYGSGGGTLDPLELFIFIFENAEKDDGRCCLGLNCTKQISEGFFFFF